jgi:hypothetical protein
MNCLLKLIIFTVFAAAISVTALAQDVLPVPEYRTEASPKFGTIATYGPNENFHFSIASPLMWEDIGVESYKITFRVIATGQKITWKPQFTCLAQCMSSGYPAALFDAVHDGDLVKWWVTAKAGDTVFKSAKVTTVVNEIDPVLFAAPADNMVVPRDNILFMLWLMVGNAVEYKLVVKNADTGALVLKRTLTSSDHCSSAEYMCGFIFGGANPTPASLFNYGTAYKWFVVSKGVSGEKAKSPIFYFSTSAYDG